MLGEGGYGRVFRGIRGGVQDIAIKQVCVVAPHIPDRHHSSLTEGLHDTASEVDESQHGCEADCQTVHELQCFYDGRIPAFWIWYL